MGKNFLERDTRISPRTIRSDRWESNPRLNLGKVMYCHCTTIAFTDGAGQARVFLGSKRIATILIPHII